MARKERRTAKRERPSRRCIEGELTVYTVGRHKPDLVRALAENGRAELDLSQVPEIDTAGLQLLLMARTLASTRGETLKLVAPSPAVREVLDLCRLHDAFAPPARHEPERAVGPAAGAAGRSAP